MKNVLNYKKPTLWLVLTTVVVCIVITVCYLTKQMNKKFDYPERQSVESCVVLKGGDRYQFTRTENTELFETLAGALFDEPYRRTGRADNKTFNSVRISFLTDSGEAIWEKHIAGNMIVDDRYFYRQTEAEEALSEIVIGIVDWVSERDKKSSAALSSTPLTEERKPGALSPEELAYYETTVFNQLSQEEADPSAFLTNMLLTSVWTSPEEIDLYRAFGNGVVRQTSVLTDAERELLSGQSGYSEYLDQIRFSRVELNACLEKHLGLTLEETKKKGLESFIYLPETDSYYRFRGDTDYCPVTIRSGYRTADGSIVLTYSFSSAPDRFFCVTMTDGNEIRFLSNLEQSESDAAFINAGERADAESPFLSSSSEPENTVITPQEEEHAAPDLASLFACTEPGNLSIQFSSDRNPFSAEWSNNISGFLNLAGTICWEPVDREADLLPEIQLVDDFNRWSISAWNSMSQSHLRSLSGSVKGQHGRTRCQDFCKEKPSAKLTNVSMLS